MTLAAILAIVVSLSAMPNGGFSTTTALQEQPKPTAQEPASGQDNPPAQTQAAPEQTPPAATPEPSGPPSQTPTPPVPENPPAKSSGGKAKPKGPAGKTRKARKRAAKPTANPNEPKKTVVSNGSTAEPVIQISSGQSGSQDAGSTNSLLDATESNLKKLSGRQLSPAQQDMVKQIRAYLEQAKTASGIGDTQGAHNLAFKAHLLSEELLKK